MQREEDFVHAMTFARQIGAIQEINQISVDLGIKILITGLLCDDLRTIIGFEIREDIMGHTISKASLVDEQNGINYSLLGIHHLAGGFPWPWYLEFEPLMPQSQFLTLTAEELQSAEEGKTPLVKINTIYDPWDPLPNVDSSLIEKLEKWREELQAPPSTLPPTWECMGQWRFMFSPDYSMRSRMCREYPCYITVPFLKQILKISKVVSGISGSMLICDSYHVSLDERQDDWKALFMEILRKSRNPLEFGNRLKSSGLNILRPMYAKLVLFNKTTGYSYPCSGSGPWGIFNTRYYYFSDCIEEIPQMRLKIEEVFNISLDEPWSFQLDLQDKEQNREMPFTVSSPFINIQGRFTVTEIYYDMEYILISYQIDIFTGNVRYVRMREMKIIDREGYEYQPLDKSSHWSEEQGTFVKGFCFPPVHYRGSCATLEINSIDIAPIVPFEFDVVFE